MIAAVAVAAPILADRTRGRVPGVVIEITLGIVIGPELLGWAQLTPVVTTLGNMGLTFLFFMAGYELDVAAIRGRPLKLATIGWFVGLAIAVAIAGLLVFTGFAISTLLIALALTTTALGTLLPLLHDNGDARTSFGAFVLAIGGVGEFLPIVAIALLLTTDNPAGEAVLLVLFVLIAAVAVAAALRPTPPKLAGLLTRHLESSAQLPIRISVLLIIVLVWIASHLGLDVLLGAFVAGLVIRIANQGEGREVIEAKLTGLAFGFFVPLFFIVSGMRFDLTALTDDPSTLLRLPLFLALFFVVRGIPVFFLYRRVVPKRDLLPLALLASTALPLVVAITEIGLQTDRMKPENAAALVGAGMLSVLLFPSSAFALRRRSEATRESI